MAFDYARLMIVLNNSKLAQTNNALYQVMSELLKQIEVLAKEPKPEDAILTTYDIDTSASAPSLDLHIYVKGLTIIKDVSGNASVNNITLVGTVDGVVDPVINSDYGSIRLIRNTKTGEYHEV